MTSICEKKSIIAKSKQVKTGWFNFQEWRDVAEFSMEDYNSKRVILPMIIVILIYITWSFPIFMLLLVFLGLIKQEE
jgi:hypothetical protein